MKAQKVHFIDRRWAGKHDEFQNAYNSTLCNVKIVFGATNNSLFLLMTEAIDKMKELPEYFDKLKKWTDHLWKAYRYYERDLRYESGFFSVKDLAPESRRFYADDLTDGEFFDYWCATGGNSVDVIRPLCLCLANKYRLMLEGWGVKDADKKCGLIMIFTLLTVQDQLWKHTAKVMSRDLGVLRDDIEDHIRPYRMASIGAAMWKLMREAVPEIKSNEPDDEQKANIELTKGQIVEMMDTTDFWFGGLGKAAEDYDEMFRTKGLMKKMQGIIAEARRHYSEDF